MLRSSAVAVSALPSCTRSPATAAFAELRVHRPNNSSRRRTHPMAGGRPALATAFQGRQRHQSGDCKRSVQGASGRCQVQIRASCRHQRRSRCAAVGGPRNDDRTRPRSQIERGGRPTALATGWRRWLRQSGAQIPAAPHPPRQCASRRLDGHRAARRHAESQTHQQARPRDAPRKWKQ
jgi:hypothetical protein